MSGAVKNPAPAMLPSTTSHVLCTHHTGASHMPKVFCAPGTDRERLHDLKSGKLMLHDAHMGLGHGSNVDSTPRAPNQASASECFAVSRDL